MKKQIFHDSVPEIEPDEITLGKIIGEGSFARVHKGTCRRQQVAVKVLHRQAFSEEDLKAFRDEVRIMSKIYHPNGFFSPTSQTFETSKTPLTASLP